MGSCLSSSSSTVNSSSSNDVAAVTAIVIALDGSLKEDSSGVTASEVLGRDQPSCFICDSDELFLDAPIPALGSQDTLQLGQLYFVLPASKLKYPLGGADMASLVGHFPRRIAMAGEDFMRNIKLG